MRLRIIWDQRRFGTRAVFGNALFRFWDNRNFAFVVAMRGPRLVKDEKIELCFLA